MIEPSYDYVIVGGGTAGCLLAARLSEDPACSICLIEAGRSASNPAISIPLLSFIASSRKRYQWGFTTEAEPELGGRRFGLIQAKVMGGASSINGTLYSRGYSGEYDEWGVPGWSFRELLPFFKRTEASDQGPNQLRGSLGPLRVVQARQRTPVTEAFLAAVASAGLPVVGDMNGDVREGFGYVDLTIERGRRLSTATALLNPVRRQPNLTVIENALVSRVTFKGKRATGVELAENGDLRRIEARREVVLCAGGIGSARMLMLSGVGPEQVLKAAGVAPVAVSPEVGRNLQNHVRYPMLYETRGLATGYRNRMPLNALAGGLRYLLNGTGFLSESALSVAGVFSVSSGSPLPEIRAAFMTTLMGPGPGAWRMLPQQDGVSIVLHQGAPFSKGVVRIVSADVRQPPQIQASYFSDPRDMPILIAGIERMRAVMREPAFSRHVVREIQPSDAVRDKGSVEAEIRAKAANIFHPVGTCRMGPDAEAVVDPELRVTGVEGLRVADTSVIPRLINSGTYALAMMVAERAATFISGRS